MSMDVKERMKNRRIELGLTLEQVGDYVGVSKSTVKKWESGSISNMRRDKIARLAEVLKISPLELMGLKEEPSYRNPIPAGFQPLPNMVKVPLVGEIACGEPITAEENLEGYIDVPEEIHCDFALKCRGDSMIEAGISDGDMVYIRAQPEVDDGQIAAVRIGDEATLKRIYYDGKKLTLVPANSKYSPKTYFGEELNDIHIEGIAVGFTHWF